MPDNHSLPPVTLERLPRPADQEIRVKTARANTGMRSLGNDSMEG